MNKKPTVLYGIADGILSGVLFLLLTELTGSILFADIINSCFVLELICVVLSVMATYILLRRAKEGVAKIYWIGRGVFALIGIFIVLNLLEIGIHIIPQRELSIADALIIIFVPSTYLAISELIRLIAFLFVLLSKKADKYCS